MDNLALSISSPSPHVLEDDPAVSSISTSRTIATMDVEDRGPALAAITWILTTVASSAVVMRLALRFKLSSIGWDDIFMCLAALFYYAMTITLTILSSKGGERHIGDVTSLGLDIVAQVQLSNWLSQAFGSVACTCGRISVSALILSILRRSHTMWQKYYLWTFCIGLELCVTISNVALKFAQCDPAPALWDPRVAGTCIDPLVMAHYGIFYGVYSTFVNFSHALIPITIFLGLQINHTEKMQLCAVFGLNVLTSICAAVTAFYANQLANRTDFTWATYDVFTWIAAELFLLLICGSLPTLKPLFDQVQRRFKLYKSKYSAGRSYTRYNSKDSGPSEDMDMHATPQSAGRKMEEQIYV